MNLEGLKREMRGSVPHFVPGQHQAWKDGEDAILVYVSQMGWANLVLCTYSDEEWLPCALAQLTATGVGKTWVPLEADFTLSAESLAALENAQPLEHPNG